MFVIKSIIKYVMYIIFLKCQFKPIMKSNKTKPVKGCMFERKYAK